MISNLDLDHILEKCGYSIIKKGYKEKKIPVGILEGWYAPNFDSVGIYQNHLINLELINPARRSRGGFAAGDHSLKMGRIDKFYQLCKDKQVKKGLLIFVQFERTSYLQKAMISRPRRLSKLKEFKRNLPGGTAILKLIDTDIVTIPYTENVNALYSKIEKCISSHGMPLLLLKRPKNLGKAHTLPQK